MKTKNPVIRVLSVVLVLAMVLNASPMAFAWSFSDFFGFGNDRQTLSIEQVDGVDIDTKLALTEVEEQEEEDAYAETDNVRVSIVLEQQPTLELYSTTGLADNLSAMAYRAELADNQAAVTAVIEQRALKGDRLDVVWNMTLAANIISANVLYGQIDEIEAVAGVKQVVIEQEYEPLTTQTAETAQPFMSTSSGMTGAGIAWAAGYTGAGSRIAVIDTGLDTDHQSFDADAFVYALEQQAQSKGLEAGAYIESLDLLDAEEIGEVLTDLNVYPYVEYDEGTAAGAYYLNEKVPFALNYVDRNYSVTHDYDAQGGHGSHVSGIAAANRYIANGEGGYDNALETVYTQGVAPDAQIIVMKVFGESGGAYESDYMVAIEDAIMLGCDVVNLSLGSNKGFARSQLYQDILDNLTKSDTVVAIAGGNSGAWADYSANGVGALYAEDVDFSVIGSPATSTNSLSVASVDNSGVTDYYLSVGESIIHYAPGVVNNAYTDGLNVIGGSDRTYILLDSIGTAEEVNAVAALAGDVSESILVVARGEISFAEKANNAAAAGFAGCIVYNNVDGTFNMDLTDYTGSGPCVSISKADGETLRSAAEAVTTDGVTYYKGTMYISDAVMPNPGEGAYTMSSFSSWGVPGSLELKPEISAPGGEIYSVDGEISSGDAYKNLSGTSMASPQIAGMAAVVMQYIEENGLAEKTGLSPRTLATSLLMATAQPVADAENGGLYSVLQQGAGLANVGTALAADAYILMDEGSTSGAADGKVKAELGDDPDREGVYTFGFTIHNFSDSVKSYTLSSDFFTQGQFEQDGVLYHDTATTDLAVSVDYVVGGESLSVSSSFSCDLNGDGLTDDLDAQVILEYAAGNLAEIDGKADLNADSSVNTFDAYLLLASLRSDYFAVQPGEDLHVQVTVELADKAALDAAYVNGAYVEGYVTVESAPDAEGLVDPAYSVPVLGFYGNWTDASMYDRADYTDYLYNDYIYPYTGGLNYLSLFYDGGMDESYFVGNPYVLEDTFPTGKAALNSETELGDMAVTLIRNASGFLFYILDGEGNIVEARSGEHLQAAYYYEAYATWVNVNNVGLSIWETPEAFGFEHGDRFTVGFMSIPEYYEENGTLSTEDLVELMESGEIGAGAFHSYSFTVDDVAPVVASVEKDTETGNLIVTAQDENYIAAVAVLNAKGSNILTMNGVEQTEQGSVVETVIDMTDVTVNRDCLVLVADYAGNETIYKVSGYNEGVNDFAGRMYGFSDGATRGTENSWMEIEPEKLHYASEDYGDVTMGGTADVANMPWKVVAAEYAGGHVFMATEDGALYVAEQGDWENFSLVAEHRNYANIKDMAYDTTTGTMYALIGSANTIYSINLVDGTLTKEYTVSVVFPRTVADANYELLTLTIDDEGNFYSVNNGDANYKRTYLFKWSDADRGENGNVKNLAPVNNTEDGYAGDYVYNDNLNYMGVECVQSMAWDHDNDILYWAAAMSSVSPNNVLYIFDTATGKVSKPETIVEGVDEYYLSVMSVNVAGLYIVPAEPGELPTATEATGITLERTELELLEGAEYTMHADVFPWNLEDTSLVWTTSDETIATVNADGVITGVSEGTATITATTVAAPYLSASCVVTVEKLQSVDLRGLLYNAEGKPTWVSFDLTDPEGWSVAPSGEDAGKSFIAGALLNNTLYLHDGNHMYGVDANTYEITDYGFVDPTWQWSDAAPATKTSDGYFDRIVGVINFGQGFGVMDVETGTGSELTHYYLFSKDRAAVIAYKGETTYTDSYGSYPAHEYYVLTEQGTLMLMTTYAFYDGDAGSVYYDDTIVDLGETGLRLTGVSDVTSGKYASMHYDAVNDYLIVSVCDGNTNELFVFDPDICSPVKVGTFGADNWPVVSLYEYAPYSELTVTVTPEEAEIYVDETVQLTSKVYLYESDDSVIWTSSDETVATVDQNGVVTGVGAGTATITATSVEGSASASSVITVKALDAMDVYLHAYITTEEGGKWVAIDGSDMSYEVLGTSDAVYTGAAVSEGKVYATDETYYYEIAPQNGYSVFQGDDFTNGDGAPCLYMLDGSSSPKTSVTLPDVYTNEATVVEMGGIPVYLSGYDGNGYYYITMLNDFTTGEYSVSPIAYTYNPAAIAYRSSEIIEDYYYFDFYMVLGYDGLLETYSLYSSVSGGEVYTAGGWEADTVNTGLVFEDGDDVSMVYVTTDTFEGVIISHADENGLSFYSYDMAGNKLGKLGRISEATDLVGLSLLSDLGIEAPEKPVDPDVPVVSDESLHGYIVTENGGAWVSIDTADMSYEALSDWSDTEYTGAGVLDGKIYASDSATYYEIDPANGYSSATGASVKWDYPMLDGTGVSAQTVELLDIYYEEYMDVNVGGHVAYATVDEFLTPYVFRLTDYAAGTAKSNYLSGISNGMAAITFLSSETDEFAENYYENYLVLDQGGKLYNLRLSYYLEADYLSTNYSVSEIGSLELNAASGASMAKTGDDEVMISVNADDGVKLYRYTLSTGELSLVGVLEDAVTLVGLSLLSDLKEDTEPEPEPTDPTDPTEPEPTDPEPTDPTDPVEPSDDGSVLGYLALEEGYAWAKIDPADGSYEIIAEDTLAYTGGGLANGKIYTSYGVSKYGQTTYSYYMVDPANGYVGTAGASCPGFGYAMADGTGTPAVTAELWNDAAEDYVQVSAGGYYVYIANGPYSSSASKVYVLHDYATADYTEPYVSSSTFSGKLAAITYVGGNVSGDELSYFENFLILGQNGTLYNCQLVTNTSGLYGAANVSTVGTLDLSAMSGASMALVDDDTVLICVNADDGVVFYHYTISTGELTEGALIEEAVSLSSLTLYSDITGESGEPEEPEEPEEPADTSMLGYLAVEDGYAWAKIDPADLSYEVLAEDTVNYNGAGVSGGKIYAVSGVSKYGQTTYTYSMIDPANGYAATAGATSAGFGYAMADGTGAPAVSAELWNDTAEDYTAVNAGGYYVYVANGPYSSSTPKVYVLHDYATAEYTEPYVSSSAFSGKLAAITYVSGNVSGDEMSYYENFLILGQNGTLYSYQLVTNTSGLYGAANVSTVGTLELTATSGASMALIDDDTVMISVNADDGVAFYHYTISTGELTEIGTLYDAVTLVGLNLYADVAAEALTTARSVSNVKGSTYAVDLGDENITVEQTMTLKLVEDVDVTNGLIEVTFDPEVLTYVGAFSLNAYYAINADQAENGKLTVAYASAEAITAGEVIAALRFSFDGELNTDLTVTVTERNDQSGLSESETVHLGESEDEGLPFTDVAEGQWFYEYVEYVYENGLMNGMSETIFNPAGTVDRAMVVTVLYRMAGSPEVAELSNFVDVPADSYCAEAIAWAEDVGVAKGVSVTHFAPNQAVTREQAAMFLYRFVTGYLGVEAGEGADLTAFADFESIAPSAEEALSWAVEQGLFTGYPDNTLKPTGTLNRAELAKLLTILDQTF